MRCFLLQLKIVWEGERLAKVVAEHWVEQARRTGLNVRLSGLWTAAQVAGKGDQAQAWSAYDDAVRVQAATCPPACPPALRLLHFAC